MTHIMSSGSSYICVLVRLPNQLVKSLRRLALPFSIYELKLRLELLVGLPASCFNLSCPGISGGHTIKNEFTFSSSDFSNENSTLLFTVLLPADISKLYDTLTGLSSQSSSQHMAGGGSVSVPVPEGLQFAALFLSSYLGWMPLCKRLITDAEKTLHRKSQGGNTALHAACMRDRVDVASLLAYSGLYVEERNFQGKTSLDTALEAGAMACYRRLKQIKMDFHREATDVQPTNEESEPSYYKEPQDSKPAETQKPSVTICSNVNSQPEVRKSYMLTLVRQNATSKAKVTSNRSASAKTPAKPTDPLLTRVLSARQRTQFKYKPADSDNNGTNQRRVRLCKQQPNIAHSRCMSAPTHSPKESKDRNKFKVTRPQYLQYIKSSTGIIEEDYFADIFPGVEEDHGSSSAEEDGVRTHKELMQRKRRIFRKMLKDSALLHSSDTDGTDSEEELVRRAVNQKAFRKWIQHKEEQKKEEEKKLSMNVQLPSDSRTQAQSLTPLIMVGDTWSTNQVTLEHDSARGYLLAYKDYNRAKSAPAYSQGCSGNPRTQGKQQLLIDPLTYDRWLDTKVENSRPKLSVTFADDSKRPNTNLIKKIQYEDWLSASNAKLRKEIHQRNKEKKYAVEFEKWMSELKEEVDTFGYWKRNKDQQLSTQRKQHMKKQQLGEKKKVVDDGKRQELSSQIYNSWLSQKEKNQIEAEQSKLSREQQKRHK